MKTILLISPYWKEQHRWMVSSFKLAELWQRIGYKVVVVCMGSNERSAVSGQRPVSEERTSVEHISDTLTIYRMRDIFFRDPWNYGIAFGFARFVGKVVKEEKPDVIVINKLLFWTSLAGIRLRLTGRRFLLLTDALVGMTWWPRGLLPKAGAFLYAWTLGWLLLLLADRVVTFHPQPAPLLRKLLIAKKTEVIPTGVDPEPFGKHHGPMTNDQVTVTYVGRLESVKGVDDFLAAAVPITKEVPSLRVQVVGWHWNDHPLVTRYNDQVTFTGLRDDVPAILSQTDIFVLPSHSEGLSNALMEAMASGCACVASDVGGNSFLIQNGVSGFLYPAGDRRALAAHIRRLLDDPTKRKALGEAARKRIEEEFSWRVVGERYRQLFEGTMRNAKYEMHNGSKASVLQSPP
ncbi:MAG: glycosyltransferase family 4 protein [Candidatus Peribacteraceae bacterium]|jgi:glycosyltransferase involved in cell wall biosynthesis